MKSLIDDDIKKFCIGKTIKDIKKDEDGIYHLIFENEDELILSSIIDKEKLKESRDKLIDYIFDKFGKAIKEASKERREREREAEATRRSLECAGHPELCIDELDDDVDYFDPLDEEY